MNNIRKKFKIPPKKYQPRGLTVIYEDHDILVVDKMSGLLTMSSENEREATAYYLLTDYVRKGNHKSRNRLFIVHRLDKDTSGVIVFAKNETAKRYLQDEWHNFTKKYFAVVHGQLSAQQGLIESYLAENRIHKIYSVDNQQQGKFAKTGYKVVKSSVKYSLLEVELFTGRKNQIRVHLADKQHPVVGDKIYGIKEYGIKRLALHAAVITIAHPDTKELMTFEAKTPTYFATLMK